MSGPSPGNSLPVPSEKSLENIVGCEGVWRSCKHVCELAEVGALCIFDALDHQGWPLDALVFLSNQFEDASGCYYLGFCGVSAGAPPCHWPRMLGFSSAILVGSGITAGKRPAQLPMKAQPTNWPARLVATVAKIKPTTVRFPDDLKALIIEAAAKCGFIRGDREQG
jgi:hypothetical protein